MLYPNFEPNKAATEKPLANKTPRPSASSNSRYPTWRPPNVGYFNQNLGFQVKNENKNTDPSEGLRTATENIFKAEQTTDSDEDVENPQPISPVYYHQIYNFDNEKLKKNNNYTQQKTINNSTSTVFLSKQNPMTTHIHKTQLKIEVPNSSANLEKKDAAYNNVSMKNIVTSTKRPESQTKKNNYTILLDKSKKNDTLSNKFANSTTNQKKTNNFERYNHIYYQSINILQNFIC